MARKKAIVECICYLLMLNFFYEGINKIAYWEIYGWWTTHKPIIKHIGHLLKYFVPLSEIAISIMIMIPSTRSVALYSIIVGEVLMILWVMSVYLFTGYLFWPYHALWDDPTWMQKMTFSLILAWLSYAALLMNGNKIGIRNKTEESLRNKPANASAGMGKPKTII